MAATPLSPIPPKKNLDDAPAFLPRIWPKNNHFSSRCLAEGNRILLILNGEKNSEKLMGTWHNKRQTYYLMDF